MNYHETQYEKHKAESDKIIESLLLDAINNTLYHDALSEAQTMIGDRELTISRLEQENQELRNALFMERSIVRG
jgi:hypothetical protein